jgi:hypothetical protein
MLPVTAVFGFGVTSAITSLMASTLVSCVGSVSVLSSAAVWQATKTTDATNATNNIAQKWGQFNIILCLIANMVVFSINISFYLLYAKRAST